MIFLISRQECELAELNITILPNVKYELTKIENKYYTFLFDGEPVCVNLFKILNNAAHKHILKVNFNGNVYLFFNFLPTQPINVLDVQIDNLCFNLVISNNLIINVNGNTILNEPCRDVTFSHFEKFKGYTFLFFNGKRKYYVLLKQGELICNGYYDEINKTESEIYVLTKLFDALNHGRVCHIKDDYENYLVYLDENELKLKPEMNFLIFLDCLKAKNYKYCNNLLAENLKQQTPEDIAKFFNEFDYFYPESENTALCFKKNALVGIYKFELENNLISNIVVLAG